MSQTVQETLKLTIPVTRKYASRIIGKNGVTIKGIIRDAGNNTRILYDDTKDELNIISINKNSLKIAVKAIMNIIKLVDNPESETSNNKSNDDKIEIKDSRYANILKSSSSNNNNNNQIVETKKTVHYNNEQIVETKKIDYSNILKSSPINNNQIVDAKKSYYTKDIVQPNKTDYSKVNKLEIPRAKRISSQYSIHPDIIKARLIYQIIGPKGETIQNLNKSIGGNCNINCSDSHYLIEVNNETALRKAKDLLNRLERKILNDPKNEQIIAELTGFHKLVDTKGRIILEYVNDPSDLIQIYKEKEQIRYKLARKLNKPLEQITENLINDEYNIMYNIENIENNSKQVSCESLKNSLNDITETVLSPSYIKSFMYSKWNDDNGLIMIKNELPNISSKLNEISLKIQKANDIKNALARRQEAFEEECRKVSLEDVLGYDDDESVNTSYINNEMDISNDDINDLSFNEDEFIPSNKPSVNRMDDNDKYLDYLEDLITNQNKINVNEYCGYLQGL
jgi:hypothetical protein